jgi:hypothetical protein
MSVNEIPEYHREALGPYTRKRRKWGGGEGGEK